jgi:hypothetical protein
MSFTKTGDFDDNTSKDQFLTTPPLSPSTPRPVISLYFSPNRGTPRTLSALGVLSRAVSPPKQVYFFSLILLFGRIV